GPRRNLAAFRVEAEFQRMNAKPADRATCTRGSNEYEWHHKAWKAFMPERHDGGEQKQPGKYPQPRRPHGARLLRAHRPAQHQRRNQKWSDQMRELNQLSYNHRSSF